jgi:hypothetical protein
MNGVLIRQGDGTWREPAYAAEHPDLIPGVSAAAKSCREFGSEVGPADIVVVDANGDLTLVECKLATNPVLCAYVG